MPNLLLVGPSNNGKTMIVEKFRRSHLPGSEESARDGAIRVPVLKVQLPPAPDERRFFSAILEALGAPDRLNDRLSTKQDTAGRMMRAAGGRGLRLYGGPHLLVGAPAPRRTFPD